MSAFMPMVRREKKSTSILNDADILSASKKRAKETGRSFSEFVETALRFCPERLGE